MKDFPRLPVTLAILLQIMATCSLPALSQTTRPVPMDKFAPAPQDTLHVDWQQLHFSPLDETGHLDPFLSTIHGLSRQEDSAYRRAWARGREWDCIVMLLETEAKIDAMAESRKNLADDPLQYRYLLYHDGYPWRFWLHLARLAQEADAFGHPEVLQPDVRRLTREMQAAFRPYLDPAKAASAFPDTPPR